MLRTILDQFGQIARHVNCYIWATLSTIFSRICQGLLNNLSEKHRYQKKFAQKGKICSKTNFALQGNFTPFISKSFQIWDQFSQLLLPKDSSQNILDIQLREVGAKRRLNGTSKVNSHTYTNMDKSTYRKHRPRRSMLWKVVSQTQLFLYFFFKC